jgi:hypothetical protein
MNVCQNYAGPPDVGRRPRAKISHVPYNVIIVERCFTIYYTLLHITAAILFIFSVKQSCIETF